MLIIQVTPSLPVQTFSSAIDGTVYGFRFLWNSQANRRTGAWFMDVYDGDDKPIIVGVKVVLGTYLGRRSTHPLFRAGAFLAYDTTRSSREAQLDDFGTRVELRYYTAVEIETISLEVARRLGG